MVKGSPLTHLLEGNRSCCLDLEGEAGEKWSSRSSTPKRCHRWLRSVSGCDWVYSVEMEVLPEMNRIACALPLRFSRIHRGGATPRMTSTPRDYGHPKIPWCWQPCLCSCTALAVACCSYLLLHLLRQTPHALQGIENHYRQYTRTLLSGCLMEA